MGFDAVDFDVGGCCAVGRVVGVGGADVRDFQHHVRVGGLACCWRLRLSGASLETEGGETYSRSRWRCTHLAYNNLDGVNLLYAFTAFKTRHSRLRPRWAGAYLNQ